MQSQQEEQIHLFARQREASQAPHHSMDCSAYSLIHTQPVFSAHLPSACGHQATQTLQAPRQNRSMLCAKVSTPLHTFPTCLTLLPKFRDGLNLSLPLTHSPCTPICVCYDPSTVSPYSKLVFHAHLKPLWGCHPVSIILQAHCLIHGYALMALTKHLWNLLIPFFSSQM